MQTTSETTSNETNTMTLADMTFPVSPPADDSALAWALRYAADGYPVFPVHRVVTPASADTVARWRAGELEKKEAVKDAVCSCGVVGCTSPGKHPATLKGVKDASLDPEQIRKWWERTPDANVGMRMPPGKVVVDFDPYEPGVPERLAEFRETAPATLEQSSGADGAHFIFSAPEDTAFGSKYDGQSGVDIIHNAYRYIVAAPSNHWTGGVYRWVADCEVAKAPAEILARCKRGAQKLSKAKTLPASGARGNKYANLSAASQPAFAKQCPATVDPEAWAVQLAKTMPPAIANGEEGCTEDGHVTLQRAAVSLTVGLGIDVEKALAILWEHYNPRCVHPWEEGADGKDGEADFERTVRAATGEGKEPGYLLKNVPEAEAEAEITAPTTSYDRLAKRTDEKPEALPTGIPAFDRQLAFGGIPKNKRVVIGGAPDAGKTSLALQIAEHWASLGVAVAWNAVDEDLDDIDTRRAQSIGIPRVQAQAKLSPEALAKFKRELGGHTFDIFENEPIDKVIQSMAERYPDRQRGVFGDSLQTICSTKSLEAKSPRERIDDIIQDVKTTQLTHPAWVVLTTELNRNAYRNRDQADNIDPMAAGKESGGIEYAAGMFLVLRSEEGGVVSVEIPKCKFGTKKPFKMRLNFDNMRFAEVPEAVVTDKLAAALDGFVRVLTWSRDNGGHALKRSELKDHAHACGVVFDNNAAGVIIAKGEQEKRIERRGDGFTVPFDAPKLDPVVEAEIRAKRQGLDEAFKRAGGKASRGKK